ncbi:enoyl-CoA hydratase/isomerase family protein [Arvimicrobium flavum]|uniref:enoyl-CoA hydratase/isomerase family protein n=1 Tax=Arvimicrobium flavum TaxID=3393320 RepID=UPI00237C1A7D|nr:enoyl-CoA hydratase/isomerase family protein [Mesorhizobium shangrilense]
MSEPLSVSERDGHCSLVLTRPARGNSLSADLVEAMHEALDSAERSGVRLLSIEGDGRNFCTGFDLAGLEATADGELLARFVRIEELLARIWAAPFTTLAVAQGRTFGAGADLFAACSVRLALPDASFSFPGAAFGLVLGTRRLARRIGEDAALSVVTSGAVIDAERAARLGLATGIVQPDELDAVKQRARRDALRLDTHTIAALRQAAGDNPIELDRDLAALVRSAARPGLVQRIIAYRAKAQDKNRTDRAAAPSTFQEGAVR